ncbi:MAG: hypothetical protein V1875_09615 [Candidatus Altiarchaeota archaeon]
MASLKTPRVGESWQGVPSTLAYPTSYAALSRMLQEVERNADGLEFGWRRGAGEVEAKLRLRTIDLPLIGRSFGGSLHSISVFPHPDERKDAGGVLRGDEQIRQLYSGGAFSPLDELRGDQEIAVEKGAIGKIELMPCIFEDEPSLLKLYPQTSAGYWKLPNILKKRFGDWQLHSTRKIDLLAKAAGFRSSVAMGPDQVRADSAYAMGLISDDVVALHYEAPYRKAGYALEKASFIVPSENPKEREFHQGRYWVMRY